MLRLLRTWTFPGPRSHSSRSAGSDLKSKLFKFFLPQEHVQCTHCTVLYWRPIFSAPGMIYNVILQYYMYSLYKNSYFTKTIWLLVFRAGRGTFCLASNDNATTCQGFCYKHKKLKIVSPRCQNGVVTTQRAARQQATNCWPLKRVVATVSRECPANS